MSLNHRYINDPQGKPEFIVLPIEEYEDLLLRAIPEDDEDESLWEDIPFEPGEYDHITTPHAVVKIKFQQDVSTLSAWRIYRNLTQAEAAERAGLSQSALSQAERKESKPQKRTREKLAKVYDCTPEQLAV